MKKTKCPFKVGDRVEFNGTEEQGVHGTVTAINAYQIDIAWDDGKPGSISVHDTSFISRVEPAPKRAAR